MTLPPGVTGKFDPECQSCQANLKIVSCHNPKFHCYIHGMSYYDPTAELKELLMEAYPSMEHSGKGVGGSGWKCAPDCKACAWERRRKELLGE